MKVRRKVQVGDAPSQVISRLVLCSYLEDQMAQSEASLPEGAVLVEQFERAVPDRSKTCCS